ncbi:glycosyltransferase family 4 protein [Duganella alba]|nr:glycosyltransferase family 4 protein [Duganella alba]
MLAYLINQYPKASHSFIRREIRELERQGWQVRRIALRASGESLPDAADREEQQRTSHVLGGGVRTALRLARGVAALLVRQPLRFQRAARQALRMSRRALRPWPYHLAYLAEACVVARLLHRCGARHLHAHFGTNAAEVALLAATLANIPYSFTVHGPEEFDHAAGLKLREKIRCAAFVVAISEFGRSQLYRHLPHAEWPKVRVVRCGLHAGYGAGPPAPPPPSPRLVCVGRLCEQKGQLLLLDALARLRTAGVALQLVLAGDGEMRDALQAQAARLGLRDVVRITGWLSGAQVRQEILNARALVLPSFAEGLPVALMEAMALGRPVISTYVAGIPELVQPGRNGWLVPPGDLDALTQALRDLLATPLADLSRMGEHGRRDVRRRHSLEREVTGLGRHFQASMQAAGQGQVAAPSTRDTAAGQPGGMP